VLALLLAKRVAWDDRPLPRRFRVDGGFYRDAARRFLVTGAASGVGRHLVRALQRRGHRVVATDVNVAALADASARDGWSAELVTTMRLDVTSDEEWRDVTARAVQALGGGLDVLLNVAGVLQPSTVLDATARQVHAHVDVNVKGVVLGTMHASRVMAAQVRSGELPRGGHIINFASLGAVAPVSGVSLYVGTKYACRGFSLCAAKDLFDHGVFVTVVMPDAIQTPMLTLQLDYEETTIAFSGGSLTLDDVERVVFDRVLPHRPREVLIPTSWLRGKMARLADVFSATLVIAWAEQFMRWRGRRSQKRLVGTLFGEA